MALQETPQANRLHIGIYGKCNSGKSSILNAVLNQEVATVSSVKGTTTDPVYKAMELHGIGPVLWIDTAGFDDDGQLGSVRIEKSKQVIQKTDIALMVCRSLPLKEERMWIQEFKNANTPVLPIVHVFDEEEVCDDIIMELEKICGVQPLVVNAKSKVGIDRIKDRILALLPQEYGQESIVGHLVSAFDTVLLVMPQDIQAPKGRLILPQVQTIRDLLDHQCIVQCCTTDTMQQALQALSKPPALIITDSQVFDIVYQNKPEESLLTSFSVLFARYKGDIAYFIESAKKIKDLTKQSKVLIAEACTHAPLTEDIGRVKIPAMLRKKVGEEISITMVSGHDFPQDLSSYDLIIHCGACMFNKKHVVSRVQQAKAQNVPMTNYGITIAFIKQILDKVVY